MLLVPNLYWIIVEDAIENTVLVKNFLNRTGLDKRTTLLNAKTPTDFKLKDKVSVVWC
jgi:galactosylgalactosylxylosylprotein 3-beta-glucuronosyltransferase 3